MRFRLIAVLVFLLAASPTSGDDKRLPCEGNPQLVGECFTIRGRLRTYNGTPSLRIWRIGTKRLLGVHELWSESDAEVPMMPQELRNKAGFGIDVFGDFEVCPLSKEKQGVMQMVCVESGKNLVIKDYRKDR